ncbi:hypothetical protein [Limisalsivibrio acetivorans]|uniref:hypothetical protein n=1 Tax=Limisalsivibrio acetivorans TaxID=1304888 RepID=UPI0003B35A8A|nr:hypothetical protein [Limisalsivibrio acetivorans]
MNRIKIDYNYAAAVNIDGGLTDTDFDRYKEKARQGLSRLIELKDKGDVGFMNLPGQDTAEIKDFAKEIKGTFNDLIIIGIGGSSLGLEAVANALLPYGYNAQSYAERGSMPRLWVADNVDPSKLATILRMCQPEDTYVCVVTKSGSTVETVSNFSIIYEWLDKDVKDVRRHICAITDPDKGALRRISAEKGLKTFEVPPSVGGRYSVLSSVGLVPAAILGVDIDRLLKGAGTVSDSDYEKILVLASIYMYYMDKGLNISVLMPYTSRLSSFSDWYCQLWGESIGKRYDRDGKEILFGSTPLRSVGVVDQHSLLQLFKEGPKDKVVTFIEVENHDSDRTINSGFEAYDYLSGHSMGELCNIELKATEAALKNTGRPSVKISIDVLDEHTLGQLFMLYQFIVPVIGLAYNVDPFDQPGVEEGKQYAYGLLERDGFSDKKKDFEGIYKKQDDFII